MQIDDKKWQVKMKMKKNIDAIQTMARVVDDALDDGDIKFALEFIGHIQSALNGLEKMIVKK